MMLIFTMALAYSVSSPIILPLALVYFIVQLCGPSLGAPAYRVQGLGQQ